MKKALFIITICSVLILGGIATSYFYFHYTEYATYQNGIFVSKDIERPYETANCLY